MFERFTEASRRAVVLANAWAAEARAPRVSPVHLLAGVLMVDDPAVDAVVEVAETLERCRETIGRPRRNRKSPARPRTFSPGVKASLELAAEEASEMGDDYIAPVHLLVGLLRWADPDVVRMIGTPANDLERIRATLAELPRSDGGPPVSFVDPLTGRVFSSSPGDQRAFGGTAGGFIGIQRHSPVLLAAAALVVAAVIFVLIVIVFA